LASFVLVGEDRPAKALLEVIIASRDAKIDALVVEDPARNPLAIFAAAHGITVLDKLRFIEHQGLTDRPGAWLINVNSTLIVPAAVLDHFQARSLNFHPGLLPQYAGLHTHQWAIRNGEQEFGVTIHRMEQKIDAGAIVGQARFPIRPDDTGLALFTRCLAVGTELFSRIVQQIIRGEALADVPQDLTLRRLYRHRDALDGRIDWNWTAPRIIDFIRAGNYEPFTSPSYVARLDAVAGFDIEVLRATQEQASDAAPGTVIAISPTGPLIACGHATAIRIIKARRDRHVMSLNDWHEYVSQLCGRRLLGRSDAQSGSAPAL
jgi:methionyl-tRNA formyltransferase